MKRFWQRIPRKLRVCFNTLTIVLLIIAAYIFLDCPALTPVQQFRRLEKANLVGPSQIIEIVDLPNGLHDHLLVADDGNGAILYQYDDFEFRWSGNLLYWEKSDGITIFPAPTHTFFGSDSYVIDLPILVFHNYPGAVRGELELTIDEGLGIRKTEQETGAAVHSEYFEKTYLMEADSDIDGYFRFNLHAESENWYVDSYGQNWGRLLGNEGLALETLCRMIDENRSYLQAYVNATVRLYDVDNRLIIEKDLTIRSVNAEKYNRAQ